MRKNTLSTFTDSSVGAAILTDSGEIYEGCYYESVIQGLGTCAERNAVVTAVSDGSYQSGSSSWRSKATDNAVWGL